MSRDLHTAAPPCQPGSTAYVLGPACLHAYRSPVKHALSICLLGVLLAGCFSRAPRVPEGVVVTEEPEPPPPPEAVAQAQRRLRGLELYVGPIDGILSPSTRVGLARFQRSRDLPVTGSLDEETVRGLGLDPLETFPPRTTEPNQATVPRPTAEEIFEAKEMQPLPQPPPGALDEAMGEAAALLAHGIDGAREALERGTSSLPGDPRGAVVATGEAWTGLAEARRGAFDKILQARLGGGFAPLPEGMLRELEAALEKRALLLRGVDGVIGRDDADAIRWVERSLGLPITGRPSLVLLEALGIDPSPMFAP